MRWLVERASFFPNMDDAVYFTTGTTCCVNEQDTSSALLKPNLQNNYQMISTEGEAIALWL